MLSTVIRDWDFTPREEALELECLICLFCFDFMLVYCILVSLQQGRQEETLTIVKKEVAVVTSESK